MSADHWVEFHNDGRAFAVNVARNTALRRQHELVRREVPEAPRGRWWPPWPFRSDEQVMIKFDTVYRADDEPGAILEDGSRGSGYLVDESYAECAALLGLPEGD